MAGYIGSKSSVTQVDGYTEAEADAEFVTKAGDTMSGNLDVTGTVTGSTGITTGVNHGNFTPVTSGTTGARINANGNGMLRLASGGVDKMYVLDSGNVGIGDSNPLSILHVGTGASANVPITFAPSTGGNIEFRNTSSTGTFTITNGNGSSENLRIDASGRVTKPSQPAFHYRLASGSAITTGNGIASVTFSVSLGATSGNGYNASTGIFTAPVAGWYAFNLTFYYAGGGSYIGTKLLQSNGDSYYSFDNTGADVHTPLSKILYLNAGDTLRPQIYTYQATTLHVAHSYFSGYLLG